MNAHSSKTNSSLHSLSACFTQLLEASHQTMRKPSLIFRSHLQTVIKTHAANSADSAPFRHFHSAQNERTPKLSIERKPSRLKGTTSFLIRTVIALHPLPLCSF